MSSVDLASHIRTIPDFPKPGILFRDINPMLRSPEAVAEVIRQLSLVCEQTRPDLIVGIESRGFIVGAPLAHQCGLGFVPVRKPGKLPGEVVGINIRWSTAATGLKFRSKHWQANQGFWWWTTYSLRAALLLQPLSWSPWPVDVWWDLRL